MSDDAVKQQPVNEEPPRGLFQHKEHVRLAWLFLQKYPLIDAVVKVSEGLKMFAEANGAAHLYNETLTWAYVFLINERMARLEAPHTWEDFAKANPDLLNWKENVLKGYYKEETLHSELAKKLFILPDLLVNKK
jgi:hypothetical protein